MNQTALVVMGVSGSGKSTVGATLAARLGWLYADGDDFHPAANIEKMAHGNPLDDADRAPWLAAVRDWMATTLESGQGCVVACSALKRAYRDVLRKAADGLDGAAVRFAFLDVDRGVLYRRLLVRHGHFMHADMLDSQLDTLEPPTAAEGAITVNVSAETQLASTVETIIKTLENDH